MRTLVWVGLAVTVLSGAFSGCSKKVTSHPSASAVQRLAQRFHFRQHAGAAIAGSLCRAPDHAASRMPDAATLATTQELLNRIQDAYFDYDKHTLRLDAEAALKRDAQTLSDLIRQYPDFKLDGGGPLRCAWIRRIQSRAGRCARQAGERIFGDGRIARESTATDQLRQGSSGVQRPGRGLLAEKSPRASDAGSVRRKTIVKACDITHRSHQDQTLNTRPDISHYRKASEATALPPIGRVPSTRRNSVAKPTFGYISDLGESLGDHARSPRSTGVPASGPGHRGHLGGRRHCLRVEILLDVRHFAISNGNVEDPLVLVRLIRSIDFSRSDADDQNPVSLRHEFGGLWVFHFHLFGRLLKHSRQFRVPAVRCRPAASSRLE